MLEKVIQPSLGVAHPLHQAGKRVIAHPHLRNHSSELVSNFKITAVPGTRSYQNSYEEYAAEVQYLFPLACVGYDIDNYEILTAYMAMPVVHSLKKRSPTSRFVNSGQGIMGFCHGNLPDNVRVLPKARSHKTRDIISRHPRTKGTTTAGDAQGKDAPPQVRDSMTRPKPKRKRNWPPTSTVLSRVARFASASTKPTPAMGCGPSNSRRRNMKLMMSARTAIGRLMANIHLQSARVR